MGDAYLLLARAYLATGDTLAARRALAEAAEHFERAGAPHRAEQAREFLRSELGTASLWSRLRQVMGFGRS
jgi:predicted Zn-dependent protease